MRHIRIRLKGFGSFADEQSLDFSELEEIFLVSGRTGSGKTTIFDVIVYALYGWVPGDQERERREVHLCRRPKGDGGGARVPPPLKAVQGRADGQVVEVEKKAPARFGCTKRQPSTSSRAGITCRRTT